MSDSLGKIKAPSLNGLVALADTIKTTGVELRRKSIIEGKYKVVATGIDIGLDYFELLGFARISGEHVHASGVFEKLINREEGLDVDAFKGLVIDSLLSGGSRSDFLNGFFTLFKETGDGITLECSLGDRLRYSDLRNLFLELGIIEYAAPTDSYRVTPLFAKRFKPASKTNKRRVIDENELMTQLEAQKILGADAELIAIQYEQERLADKPELLVKIEHTAKVDAGAGYDILSWDINGDKRHIEVKAVPPVDIRFHWSSNEIGAAAEYGERYFLYLLPVVSGKMSPDNMRIIQNPHKEVFLNEKDWTKVSQTYTIWENQGHEATNSD